MALVSVVEAGRLVGRDRKTIYRHIQSGRLSATQDHAGTVSVETSELIRVYGELLQAPHVASGVALPQMSRSETASSEALVAALAEIEDLKQQVAHEKSRRESSERAAGMLTARMKDKESLIEDLRRDKDDLRQDRDVLRKALDRAMLLIEDKTRPRHMEPAPMPEPTPPEPQPLQEQDPPILQEAISPEPAKNPDESEKNRGFWAKLFRQ